MMLSRDEVESFIRNGFVKIESAFSSEIARKVRSRLWQDIEANEVDPSTWTKPVVRLGMYNDAPFIESANTSALYEAFDQLAGSNRWMPLKNMGTFPIRFPSNNDPGDTGWHVDASFPRSNQSDYFSWRVNYKTRSRALLMLFLYSDVSAYDAPTRLKVGSHLDVARLLHPYGEDGLSFMELAYKLDQLPPREEVVADGQAGTVYLCHPFMVHAAQNHVGKEPRFLAQPPLLWKHDVTFDFESSPIEKAISIALE